MNRIDLKEQLVIFGIGGASVSPDVIIQLMTSLSEYRLMPSQVKELNVNTGLLTERMSLSNSETGLSVVVGGEKIDVFFQRIATQEDNQEINQYSTLHDISKKIVEIGLPGGGIRVCYIKEYFLILSTQEKENVFKNIFSLMPPCLSQEWTYKFVEQIELKDEVCNQLIELSRVQGKFQRGVEFAPLDEIKITIEINTHQDNSKPRDLVNGEACMADKIHEKYAQTKAELELAIRSKTGSS